MGMRPWPKTEVADSTICRSHFLDELAALVRSEDGFEVVDRTEAMEEKGKRISKAPSKRKGKQIGKKRLATRTVVLRVTYLND